MDRTSIYRDIIERVLSPHTKTQYAHGDITNYAIFDRENDRYLILSQGWDGVRRIHGCLIHLDLIEEKVWIQRDGTEDGIGYALMESGIPKEHIVLGFKSPQVRPLTGFAVA